MAQRESWVKWRVMAAALSGLVGREIGVAKDARLQFDLLQPTLDRITDADDSYQLALLDDRQMPNPTLGHLDHDALECVFPAACDDLASHQVFGLEPQQVGAVFGQGMQNVALRQDSE